MKEIDLPDWPRRLARARLPDRQQQHFAIALRWYLSFGRRGRGGVNAQSAREFMAGAQQIKRPEPRKLENRSEAIRTVQELRGHKSVETTMIYTHRRRRPELGVKSPRDT